MWIFLGATDDDSESAVEGKAPFFLQFHCFSILKCHKV